jgi:hypothetical protein
MALVNAIIEKLGTRRNRIVSGARSTGGSLIGSSKTKDVVAASGRVIALSP